MCIVHIVEHPHCGHTSEWTDYCGSYGQAPIAHAEFRVTVDEDDDKRCKDCFNRWIHDQIYLTHLDELARLTRESLERKHEDKQHALIAEDRLAVLQEGHEYQAAIKAEEVEAAVTGAAAAGRS